jgi:ferritin-like metal-binding protein YciE
MKLVSEKLPDLEALYVKQLRMLLSGEELILRGLPRMAEMAADGELKQAFRSHVEETERQAVRLRTILEALPGDHDPLKCKAVSALIDEAEDMIEDSDHEQVRDAALIAAAQRIEHYEIAGYGAVRHFAGVLKREQDVTLLSQTIEEEGSADHHLTGIAERINPTARKAA